MYFMTFRMSDCPPRPYLNVHSVTAHRLRAPVTMMTLTYISAAGCDVYPGMCTTVYKFVGRLVQIVGEIHN